MGRNGWSVFLFIIAVALLTGCNTDSGSAPSSASNDAHDHDHDHHGHDHGHDHSHEGPHGGHIMGLGDEEYHAEWIHEDETGKITVYLLDAEAKEEVAIAADSIAIEVRIAEKDPKTYELKAVSPSGDPPSSARFEIVDQGLLTNLLVVGEGAEATLTASIDGKDYSGTFEHHDHDHDHGHAH